MSENEVPAPINDLKVRAFLNLILSSIRGVLGERLVGLYLYGSLVTGDFDYDISDLDLLAATTSDLNEQEFLEL